MFIFLFLLVRFISCNSIDNDLSFLFNLCKNDEICSYHFYQTEKENQEIFNSLVLPIYDYFNQDINSLIQKFDSLSNEEKKNFIIIRGGLVYLRSLINLPNCLPQQTIQVNSDSSFNCVCQAGSDCSIPTSTNALLIALLVLLNIITLIVLGFFIWTNHNYFKKIIFR